MTQPAGQADQSSATVVLPSTVNADLYALHIACPSAVAAAGACPASSQVGTAVADSPLLPVALSGPVYLVQAPGTAILPELQVRLGGPIPLVLRGTTVARQGRLATTFAGLPDVPLSRFELSLKAGGILVAAKDLCTGTPAPIDGEFVAHSGKRATAQAPAKPVGCARSASSKTRRPTATATVRGHRLTVRVKAGARRLRDARLRLGRRTVQRRPKRPARTLTLTARVTRAPRRVTVRVVDSTRRVTTLRAKVRRQPKR